MVRCLSEINRSGDWDREFAHDGEIFISGENASEQRRSIAFHTIPLLQLRTFIDHISEIDARCQGQSNIHEQVIDTPSNQLPRRMISNISLPFGAVVRFSYPFAVTRMSSSMRTPPMGIYSLATSKLIYLANGCF